MSNIAKSWQLIEEVLWENSHSVYRALRKPASEARIRNLENKLSARLPRDFVQSLKIHDGLRDSYLGQIRLFNYWALLPVRAIFKVWKSLTSLLAEYNFDGRSSGVTPRIKSDAHWRRGWVPFMDSDGDQLMIDMDPGAKGKVGQVIMWSRTDPPLSLLADSYGEWLASLADALSKRRFRLDEFGDIWLENEKLHR